MNSVVEHLKKARSLVEQGWTQVLNRVPGRDTTYFCAVGALRCADLDDPMDSTMRLPNWESWDSIYAARYMEGVVGDIATWNDDPERTQEEVLLAFDRAIALAEKGEGA